jgi:hypothetical protein
MSWAREAIEQDRYDEFLAEQRIKLNGPSTVDNNSDS